MLVVPVLVIFRRFQTDTGTPGPPALGLVTICSVPVTPALPEAVMGGLPIGSLSVGYSPSVCTSVALADSPGILATLTKVTAFRSVVPLAPGAPHWIGWLAADVAGRAMKQATGATP